MLKTEIKVPSADIKKAMRILKTVDQGMAQQLRADIKGQLKPFADKIAGQVPTKAPLSGMTHSGRTRWTGARGSVSFVPGKFSPNKDFQPLVSVRLQGKSGGAGFDIAEVAGSAGLSTSKPRTSAVKRGNNPKWTRANSKRNGQAFLNNIEPRSTFPGYEAGRFGYGNFLKERGAMQKVVINILNDFIVKFNKKIKRL